MGMIKALPAALKFLMSRRGISQTELAKRASLQKSQVSKYLNGSVTPKLHQIDRLIEGLEVDEVLFFTVVSRMREIDLLTDERPDGRRRRGGDPMLAMYLDFALGPPAGDDEDDGDFAPSDPVRKLIRLHHLSLESHRLLLELIEERYAERGPS